MARQSVVFLVAITVFFATFGFSGCTSGVTKFSGYSYPPNLSALSGEWEKIVWVYQTSYAPGGFNNSGANEFSILVKGKSVDIFAFDVSYDDVKIESSRVEWKDKDTFVFFVNGGIINANGTEVLFENVTTFHIN